jgi:hypothetical protein
MAAVCLLFLGAACASYNTSPTPVPTFTTPESLPDMPQSGGFDQMDAYREGRYKMSGSFNVTRIEGGNFQLGHVKERWDTAMRYELDFLFHFGMQKKHLEPLAGAYVFWENRDWSAGGISSVDCDTIGFGLETGANLFAFEGGEQAKFNMGLLPYARFGFGFQSGTFDNMPSSLGYSTGNLDGQRFEITLGLDAHVMLLRTLRLALGGGFTYWGSTDQSAVTRDGMGNIIDPHDSLSFRGNDLFLRASVGLKF